MINNTQQLFSLIEKNISALHPPFIIGISGTYTSGKTLFSAGLARYLQSQGKKVQIIHYDDFHHPFPAIHWTDGRDDEINAFYNKAFDSGKLINEVLIPLEEKGVLNKEIDCIDLGSGQHTKKLHLDIDVKTIVILEGVLLFRAPILPFLNYKIFLDISDKEMLRRGTVRDVPKFGHSILDLYRSRYIPVHHRYLEEDSPKAISDIVLDNTHYDTPVMLSSEIK